ncbi:MAG: electron transfer flavoprotein subunit beta/FixA family protein, partial [Nitrospinae bacterium]|nr:electron transfer flavoprotein subunit beta/FixA family protein [Nitrospinota bacterium]
KQAIDGDTAQVGPEMAEFLDMPHIAYIRKIEDIKPDSIKVQRMMDEGYDIVESSLPVLLTVVKELNQPRLPSLKGKMAAKKTEIKKLGPKELEIDEKDTGLKGSPTQVKNIFAPEARGERKILAGNIEEQVNQLAEELKQLKCL